MPAAPLALLLGAPGWHPFNGHVRLRLGDARVGLHLAGALNSASPPPEAFAAAGTLRTVLSMVTGGDRFALLRDAWERLAALDPATLGPAAGADLALLLVAFDPDGLCIAGTGLAAVWGLDGGRVRELVPSAHPLLALTGIPPHPPGVFVPDPAPASVVGAARSGALEVASWPSWERACGLLSEEAP
jgi:hypothetical protein